MIWTWRCVTSFFHHNALHKGGERMATSAAFLKGDFKRTGKMELSDEQKSQMWINSVNSENKEALLAWVKETGIELVQINGQRKYGGPPPGWIGNAPVSGSEVFIGKIPQDIYEDKLIPLFQSVGKLYEFRLMMTFSGLNRGFAYARYISRRQAISAIMSLNGFEITKGCCIVVCRSTEKSELALDGLPGTFDENLLKNVLDEVTSGVSSISLHPSPTKESQVLAVVKYDSHRAAAMAKKTLCEGSPILPGLPLTVNWLKTDMRQKLRSTDKLQQTKDLSPLPLLYTDRPDLPKETLLSAVGCLNMLCQEMKLGRPVFLIKLFSVTSFGWIRFWYQVVIPTYPTPFCGYAWMIGENLELNEKYEHARQVVAMKILSALGYIPDFSLGDVTARNAL
ncbi:dead end protein homolog 1 [Xenopus laevis]|uniref:Dead end protein homolog 1 n=1 Tax=Xenopus laevis TaxID=8355 RepID=A0A8J0UQ61_XENLA|nr:dead end protein homolog 1 [Xenopus laevis]